MFLKVFLIYICIWMPDDDALSLQAELSIKTCSNEARKCCCVKATDNIPESKFTQQVAGKEMSFESCSNRINI